MQKLRIFLISILAVICFGGFIWLGSFVPARIDVTYTGPDLDGTSELKLSDFDISVKSLFGFPCENVQSAVTTYDQNKTALVSAGEVQQFVTLPCHKISAWHVKYNGKLYAGQSPDASKIAASVTWDDGTEHKLETVDVTSAAVPGDKTYDLIIYAGNLSYKLNLPVAQIKKLTAAYTGDQLSGGVFHQKDVNVTAEYEDGMFSLIREYFVVDSSKIDDTSLRSYNSVCKHPELQDAIKTIKTGDSFQVYTPYGNASLQVNLASVKSLTASYDGKVYEGDKPDKNRVSLKVVLSDNSERILKSDLKWHPVRVFFPADFQVKTNYGSTTLHIDPVRIIETRGYGKDLKAGDSASVKQIRNFYADGTTKDIDMEYVKWLNLPDKLKAGDQTAWIQSGSLQYNVHIFAESDDKYRGGEQYETYTYTFDLAQQLGLIAKASGNQDEASMVDELCVMMNRFELYGDQKEQGNAQNLYNYVVKSGLWGGVDAIASATTGKKFSDAELSIVMDMLQNGYRPLPKYVDMRSSFAGIQSKNSLDLEKDQTDMVIQNQHIRYYASGKDDNTIYGYSAEAYKKITGNDPSESKPVNTEEKKRAEEAEQARLQANAETEQTQNALENNEAIQDSDSSDTGNSSSDEGPQNSESVQSENTAGEDADENVEDSSEDMTGEAVQ